MTEEEDKMVEIIVKKGLILVIDEIYGFLGKIGNLANEENMVVVPGTRKLLKRKIPEGCEVLFLCDGHKKGDPELKIFDEHCMAGTDEAKVVDELFEFVTPKNYIPKPGHDGFYGTNLEEIIKQKNPDYIIVVGVCTDICVLYTIMNLRNIKLRNPDYQIIVPKDCVRAFDVANTDVWLDHMKNVLDVQIVETQEEI